MLLVLLTHYLLCSTELVATITVSVHSYSGLRPMAYVSKTNDNTILKYTRMIDNNNHVVVLRLIISHITIQLIPARRGESSLSWPLSFLCQEGVCAATDLVLHLITYWVGNLMHFNMVHRTRVELVLLGWKPSVLTDRRTVHLPSTNCKRTFKQTTLSFSATCLLSHKNVKKSTGFLFLFQAFSSPLYQHMRLL